MTVEQCVRDMLDAGLRTGLIMPGEDWPNLVSAQGLSCGDISECVSVLDAYVRAVVGRQVRERLATAGLGEG
jgi:hypothetical protein